jgi:hypothetical protein
VWEVRHISKDRICVGGDPAASGVFAVDIRTSLCILSDLSCRLAKCVFSASEAAISNSDQFQDRLHRGIGQCAHSIDIIMVYSETTPAKRIPISRFRTVQDSLSPGEPDRPATPDEAMIKEQEREREVSAWGFSRAWTSGRGCGILAAQCTLHLPWHCQRICLQLT